MDQLKFTMDDVSAKVHRVLVDALLIDDAEITPEASVSGDLGAESIDWLDIMFRLGQTFTIDENHHFKIPRGDLFPESWDVFLKNPEYVRHEMITQQGLDHARKQYPDADFSKVIAGVPFTEVRNCILTVAYVQNYIVRRLREKNWLLEPVEPCKYCGTTEDVHAAGCPHGQPADSDAVKQWQQGYDDAQADKNFASEKPRYLMGYIYFLRSRQKK